MSSLRDLFQIGFRSTDILSLTGRVFVVITITPFPAGSEPNGKYCMNVNLCICIGHNGDLVMDQFNSWLYHLITTAIMFSLLFSTASPNAFVTISNASGFTSRRDKTLVEKILEEIFESR